MMNVNIVPTIESNAWESIPQGQLCWLPNFLSRDEADRLYDQLEVELNWQQKAIFMYGRKVLQPRLQAWCGEEAYTYSGLRMEPAPWTPGLKQIRDKLYRLLSCRFNTVLVNKYRDGSDYMGWHQDNETELGHQPIIASVSLGETRRFVLRHLHSRQKREFELTHGSLLVMAGDLQQYWQHTIPKTLQDKQPRINLTYRWIDGGGPQS